MKKIRSILLVVLALAMVLAFSACGGKTPDDATNNDTTVGDATADATADDATATDGATLGDTLVAAFNDACTEGADTEAIANAIAENEVFAEGPALMPMPVEEGLLNGFDNYEVKGFKAATMAAPMIGSIPFVAYVFELDADADADAFATGLKDNANPRWNICTEADQTMVSVNGSFVFFVMCPATLDAE